MRKAIRANPRMTRATKMRALSTVERKLWRANHRPSVRDPTRIDARELKDFEKQEWRR